MARAPDARAEQAKELFLSGKKLIEISEALGVPEGTVRSWKNRYGWESNANATLQKPKRNVAKRKGGQPGNKNAVTTGEFETLFFDTLEPDERQLIGMIQPDKEQLLLQEIQLLTVRERRMLKRIEDLRDCDFTTVKKKKGTEKDKWIDLKEDQAVLGQIQSIEDALTRVQGRKQRAIESLHKFGFDDARLEIELMKTELAALKLGGQETELEDDGFLGALNAEAGELWGDVDDS